MSRAIAPDAAAAGVAARVALKRRLPAPAMRRALRLTAGLSAAELAVTLGVDRSTVIRWEAGIRRPRGARLAAYAAVLEELGRADGGSAS